MCRPFPAPLTSLAAFFLRCAPDTFRLTKPNTFLQNLNAASLRSDGVRDHPGMPFGFPPELAFSFAGIPKTPRSKTKEPKKPRVPQAEPIHV